MKRHTALLERSSVLALFLALIQCQTTKQQSIAKDFTSIDSYEDIPAYSCAESEVPQAFVLTEFPEAP